jgi:hypothetical protein
MINRSGVLIARAVDRLSDPPFSSKDFLKTIVLNVKSAFMVGYGFILLFPVLRIQSIKKMGQTLNTQFLRSLRGIWENSE